LTVYISLSNIRQHKEMLRRTNFRASLIGVV
jgi:hypothetical protein